MVDTNLLQTFLNKAGASTYAGGGKYEETPERAGFRELVFSEGDFDYRDSYAGFYRSWGSEVVRYKGMPVWNSLYGGDVLPGNEAQAGQIFEFLKKALIVKKLSKSVGGFSHRGPSEHIDGEWKYTYQQNGDIQNFSGHEDIYFQGKLVFTHDVMGGIFIDKS